MVLAPFYEIIPRSNVMNFNCSRMINFWPTITKEKSLNYRNVRIIIKITWKIKQIKQEYVSKICIILCIYFLRYKAYIFWPPLYGIRCTVLNNCRISIWNEKKEQIISKN